MIGDLLRSPEAHADPYVWLVVLLAHGALGAGLVASTAWLMGAWRAALAISVGYLVGWEGLQLALYGGALSDSLVDAAALTCGAVLAAALWQNAIRPVAASLALLAAIGVFGWRQRK